MKYEDMSRDELIKEVERLSSLLKSAKSDNELKKTIQELQTGQIKLQEENRELRKKQLELEEDRKRCREIYDFASSGYCAVDELILSERNKLKSILDAYPYGIYIVNKQYDIEYINPVIEREFGQIMNRKCFEYFHNLKEPCQWCKNEEVFSGKTVRWEWTGSNGKTYDLFDMPFLNANGDISKLELFYDITERKKAEEEREKLHAQLLHAQKMESVGRLAGGVAHDFNNILGIIISISELIVMDLTADDPLYARVQQIINSSERAANLVGQLLAFARKQTVSPRTVDINETISSMIKILHRIIGEDIELIWSPGYNLGKVRIDPTQIDQILANLVINSRDAIPGIGSITLATENVVFENPSFSGYEEIPRGEYVMLVVSDTGSGISKEVMKNIFEPFFTTKEVGKGTGLGLATVYGIVSQNNGYINIYSEEGNGTVFRIYLPCVKSENPPPSSDKHAARPDGGTETILVAEDEEDYLLPCKMILEKLGYTVITAKTPHEAINLAENYAGNIHLLVTDVIMPEMSGKDLMERLHTIRPDMKCLYMSGYTADIIAHHGVLEEGVKFIEKPFSIKTIAKKVREVLD